MRHWKRHVGALCALLFTASCWAVDLVWDGRTYLDIGLQLGADTTLVWPEPVEVSAENEDAFEREESATDPRIMAIRPKRAQEQRVTFVGTKSKTIYLARFSTRSSYAPLYRIKDRVAIEAARNAAAPQMTPTSLMRQMMIGKAVNGVSNRRHAQDLLAGTEYKIASVELWETPTMTGIVANAALLPGVAGAAIRPSDISLRIPALGSLRMMGADRWEIQGDARSTTVYFVFTR